MKISGVVEVTCIINSEGVCWCGQQWDGEKMVSPHTETNDRKQRVS